VEMTGRPIVQDGLLSPDGDKQSNILSGFRRRHHALQMPFLDKIIVHGMCHEKMCKR
jgi:hypothetical protein